MDRQEVRVARAVNAMELHSWTGRVQLQVEGRRLDAFCSLPVSLARRSVNVSETRNLTESPPVNLVDNFAMQCIAQLNERSRQCTAQRECPPGHPPLLERLVPLSRR